jgi:hypothetical protein
LKCKAIFKKKKGRQADTLTVAQLLVKSLSATKTPGAPFSVPNPGSILHLVTLAHTFHFFVADEEFTSNWAMVGVSAFLPFCFLKLALHFQIMLKKGRGNYLLRKTPWGVSFSFKYF